MYRSGRRGELGQKVYLDSKPDFATFNVWDINLGIYLILWASCFIYIKRQSCQLSEAVAGIS